MKKTTGYEQTRTYIGYNIENMAHAVKFAKEGGFGTETNEARRRAYEQIDIELHQAFGVLTFANCTLKIITDAEDNELTNMVIEAQMKYSDMVIDEVKF